MARIRTMPTFSQEGESVLRVRIARARELSIVFFSFFAMHFGLFIICNYALLNTLLSTSF